MGRVVSKLSKVRNKILAFALGAAPQEHRAVVWGSGAELTAAAGPGSWWDWA